MLRMDTLIENSEPPSFLPRKLSKCRNTARCAVSGCNSKYDENLTVRFHAMPRPNERIVHMTDYFGNSKNVDKLEAWKIRLKINEINSKTKVCSLHFKKEDYFFPDAPAKIRKLRRDAIPSCNLPGRKMKSQTHDARLRRCLKRNISSDQTEAESIKKQHIKTQVSSEPSDGIDENRITNYEQYADFHTVQALPAIPSSQAGPTRRNRKQQCNIGTEQRNDDSDENVSENSCQPNNNFITREGIKSYKHPSEISKLYEHNREAVTTISDTLNSTCPILQVVGVKPNPSKTSQDAGVQFDPRPNFLESIKNNRQLRTTTGLDSFEILHTIVKCVKFISGDQFEVDEVQMKTIDRIVMTFVKLKQKLSYDFLAILFDCISEESCEKIFIETIHLLRKCLNAAIPWPSSNEILQDLPECFKDYENLRIILDCVELKVERPHNHCSRVMSNSHHDDIQSYKFLTGVTPRGYVSFVSKAYDGRSSDSAIFEQSELIKLLESGDCIMVNRGFPIDEFCEKNQWKLIRPSFLRGEKPLTKEESIHTARIAHIERVNQQKKFFKILGNTIPEELLPVVDDIFYVMCAVFNLSFPIIRHEKLMKNQL